MKGETMVELKSLADFRRFLALPGAIVQLIRHDNCPASEPRFEPMWKPRTVAKLQTNAVKFSNGSWLYWDKTAGALGGGASCFRFEGDVVTFDILKDGSFSRVFQYECKEAP